MAKYLGYLLLYIVAFVVSMLLAIALPAFAVMRVGSANNGKRIEIEPRLPVWLFWFDTSTDNGLWGDAGWREKHCPGGWGTYSGMVRWLWRNPACGFSWSRLSHAVVASEVFELTSSGCGLNLDKGREQQGWFMIRSNRGAFQFRWVKEWHGWQLSMDSGWLLDVYLKDREAINKQPRALFNFDPKIVRAK